MYVHVHMLLILTCIILCDAIFSYSNNIKQGVLTKYKICTIRYL